MNDTAPPGASLATPDQPAMPAPASGAQRLTSLDFTRGIAVLGILAANIAAFGHPVNAAFWPGAFLTAHDRLSDLLWAAQFVLIDGKMRGLFTLLFGAGLVLFVTRKDAAAGDGTELQVRRLMWLLVFGMAHFFLLWRGDILTLYAACGFIGLAAIGWRPKKLLLVAGLAYLIGTLLLSLMLGSMALMEAGGLPGGGEATNELTKAVNELIKDGRAEQAIILDGNWFQYVAHNFTKHGSDVGTQLIFALFETVPLMMAGMALFRLGLFDGRLNQGRQMRWGLAGIALGLALQVPLAWWALDQGLDKFYLINFIMVGIGGLARLPMILGLAAVLPIIGARAHGWLGERLVAAGRMAFSNYLGTSLLMLFVFHGWAGGLYGQLTRPELYVVVLGAWGVMLLWSKAWLDRFRYGPLEWLWRCLTYWQRFPLRR